MSKSKSTPKELVAKKPAQTEIPAQSDKDQVKSKFKDSVICKEKNGFVVMSSKGITKKPLHSGIAKTESDAWKKALHSIL